MFGSGKLKTISKGSNSRIMAYGQGQNKVALKLVLTSCLRQCRHLRNQFEILSQICHPNVVKVIKYKENIDVTGKQLNTLRDLRNAVVMECATHGSLLDYFKLNRPSFALVKTIVQRLASTVHYLHNNGIAHRDLKLENILIFEEGGKIIPKISDFGFASKLFQKGSLRLFNQHKGTRRGYMAPEIHNITKERQDYYDAQGTDVFALGVIMFSLMLGTLPFEYATLTDKNYSLLEEDVEEFWKVHQKSIKRMGQNKNLTEQQIENFKNLFESMVVYDATKRISIQEALNHSWLRQ